MFKSSINHISKYQEEFIISFILNEEYMQIYKVLEQLSKSYNQAILPIVLLL